MEKDKPVPTALIDIPEATREFLGGMRPEELQRLKYLVEEFSAEDLVVIAESLENLRAMKRFGRFGLWVFGFIVAGAGAAGAVKVFFSRP